MKSLGLQFSHVLPRQILGLNPLPSYELPIYEALLSTERVWSCSELPSSNCHASTCCSPATPFTPTFTGSALPTKTAARYRSCPGPWSPSWGEPVGNLLPSLWNISTYKIPLDSKNLLYLLTATNLDNNKLPTFHILEQSSKELQTSTQYFKVKRRQKSLVLNSP